MEMHKLDKTIKKYKNSFNPYYFNDTLLININDNPNPTYYHKVINSWLDQRSNELVNNELLKCKANLLNEYLEHLRWLMICTVELYEAIHRYDGTERAIINTINNKEFEVLETLKAIKDFKISINLNYENGNDELSIRLAKYCLDKFNECVRNIEKQFFIRINDSPISKEFKKARVVYGGLINLDDVKILEKKGKNKKETIWFKVGLLFATGEIDKLFIEYKNPRQIAKHLIEPSFEKYILATKNNYKKTNLDKNVYHSLEKMKLIVEHCKENQISISDNFNTKYNQLKSI